MQFSTLKVLWLRVRWAAQEAREAAQTVVAVVVSALVGAGGGYLASQSEDPSVFLVLGMALLGVLAPVIVVFVRAFLTIPRRHLEWRISQLEEGQEQLQAQMTRFVEERHGDPLQFLPIYHELRADVREAIRIIERARDTGLLWPRTQAPEYKNWKRHRENIANNPFARLDNLHGVLLEAFDHLERLNSATALRFRTRRVRKEDDLDVALAALATAEDGLTFSINRLESLSPGAEELPGIVEEE